MFIEKDLVISNSVELAISEGRRLTFQLLMVPAVCVSTVAGHRHTEFLCLAHFHRCPCLVSRILDFSLASRVVRNSVLVMAPCES